MTELPEASAPSLLDQFSMAALTGMSILVAKGRTTEEIARDSYALAHAMMRVRGLSE